MLNLAIAAAVLARPALPDGMTVIQQWQVHEPVAPAQLSDSCYQLARKIGITSMQSYVGWTQLEPEQGRVTYEVYDPVVEKLRRHELKWLPFIITSPRIATPKWFRESKGVDYVCLEHNRSVGIQSMWSPHIRDGVKRFLKLFRDHYEPGVIEALNLGISGNWGESIVPVSGGFRMQNEHSHEGWWCGDSYARADFRRWAEAKYATISALNAAWKTSHKSFDEVDTFMPPKAPSRRAAVDLVDWYLQSMNDYSEFWIKAARELYPDLPIYLCTGGPGQSARGADFGAQAKICARYGAGIRITNEHDDAARNFAITRMVSSACRLYGGYYTTEPAGDNSSNAIAGRVFDAVSGGACGAYFKGLMRGGRVTRNAARFRENSQYFVRNVPDLGVAALAPNSSFALDAKVLDTFLLRAAEMRDALGFEYIDENMISDGLLDRFSAVFVLAGDTLEEKSLAKLREWVEAGGVLIAPEESLPLRTVEDEPADWAPRSDGVDPRPLGKGFVVSPKGEWTDYRLALNTALHQTAGRSPWRKQLAEPIDAAFDGVLACRVGDGVYYLNNTSRTITKRTADGKETEIKAHSILGVTSPPRARTPTPDGGS